MRKFWIVRYKGRSQAKPVHCPFGKWTEEHNFMKNEMKRRNQQSDILLKPYQPH